MERVLMTGAAGGIGRRMRQELKGLYKELRLSDVTAINDVASGESFVRADLADLAQVEKAVAGVEGIIHLGGMSVENSWEIVHEANIVGCYNLFEAARRQGVKRVIFASSNHAIGFYPRSRRIGTDHKVRPDGYYGVSKAFGESLGALYADKWGLRVLAIRIGNFADEPVDHRRLSIWLSPADLVQLLRIGLEHPALHYEVVYGVSDNERGWWDNEAAFRLGYRPTGKGEAHREAAMAAEAKLPKDPIAERFQGGSFCSIDYKGDLERWG
jgi:uronate dehydrogenase